MWHNYNVLRKKPTQLFIHPRLFYYSGVDSGLVEWNSEKGRKGYFPLLIEEWFLALIFIFFILF